MDDLDRVAASMGAAADSADDAIQACQRAGEPRELVELLQGVSDGLDQVRRGIEDVKGRTDAERQEAENWGN